MKGIISAGHELTARAGIEMYEAGGNAFDAAVAACFASFVAESALTSPGGGGFLMAHTSEGATLVYDFFVNVPGLGLGDIRKREKGFFSVSIDFAGARQGVHIGEGSAAVPGVFAGLSEVHKNHCTLPLAAIMAPAIRYAREGIELTSWQAYFSGLLSPMLSISDEVRGVYAPADRFLKAGDRIFHGELASAFEYLSKEGLHKFYEGEMAGRVLEGFGTERGGLITGDDLKSYRVIARKPLELGYRDRRVFTNPPPSSGGCLTAFALKLLERFDVRSLGHNTSAYLKLLAEATRVTNEARSADFDHRVYEEGMEEEFLSEARVSHYVKKLKVGGEGGLGGIGRLGGPGAAGAAGGPGAHEGTSTGSTTQVSAVDAQGNVASVTTSVGMGCGFMIPGTGIMMNNMLGEKDLNPLGFHGQPPGMRMSSMMAPTIVMRDSAPEIVLGSGGSKRIRSAILQAMVNLIDHGLPVSEAVNSPRVHWEKGVLDTEQGIDEEELAALEKEGFNLKRWEARSMYFGGVHTVCSGPGGFSGAGDSRRGGVSKKIF